MPNKSVFRATAVLSTLALLTLSGAPAFAAEPVAQASASGVVVTVSGKSTSTGSYAVTNDGTTETATGTNKAALPLVAGQNAITFGTIAQDAKTTVTNGEGTSVACAGAAGNGASLASVGNGATCLSGGRNVDISGGTLNLSNVKLVDNPALDPLNNALKQVLNPVGAQLNTVTTQLFAQLGNPAVVASLGAVQSSCQATTTTATGTANIANAVVYVDLPAMPGQASQRINLLTLPVNPAPNTKVVTQLDKVVTVILDAVRFSLNQTATGALAPLKSAVDALDVNLFANIQKQLVDGVLGQIAPQLKPLEDNLLRGTLNKQTKASPSQITVTALDLEILPAQQALGISIGTSSCGPNGRVVERSAAVTPPNKNTGDNKPAKPNAPNVPTSVPAGLASSPSQNAPLGPVALAALGGLLALSAATGAAVHRRNARI